MRRILFHAKRGARNVLVVVAIAFAVFIVAFFVYEFFIAGHGMSPAEIGGSR